MSSPNDIPESGSPQPHGEQRDKREPGRAKRRRVEQMHGQRRVEHDFETDQNAKGNGKHEPG